MADAARDDGLLEVGCLVYRHGYARPIEEQPLISSELSWTAAPVPPTIVPVCVKQFHLSRMCKSDCINGIPEYCAEGPLHRHELILAGIHHAAGRLSLEFPLKKPSHSKIALNTTSASINGGNLDNTARSDHAVSSLSGGCTWVVLVQETVAKESHESETC